MNMMALWARDILERRGISSGRQMARYLQVIKAGLLTRFTFRGQVFKQKFYFGETLWKLCSSWHSFLSFPIGCYPRFGNSHISGMRPQNLECKFVLSWFREKGKMQFLDKLYQFLVIQVVI